MTAERTEAVVSDPYAQRRGIASKVTQAIYLIFGIVEALLAHPVRPASCSVPTPRPALRRSSTESAHPWWHRLLGCSAPPNSTAWSWSLKPRGDRRLWAGRLGARETGLAAAG